MTGHDISQKESFLGKLVLSAVLLIAMGFFFVGDHLYSIPTLRPALRIVLIALPTLFLLALTLIFQRRVRLKRYWEVVFAYFCGSTGLFLAWAPGSWPERVWNVSASTPQGIAILKFFEFLPVAIPVILLTWFVHGTLTPIYIPKGNLRFGLGLGLPLSFAIIGIYLVVSWSTIDKDAAVQGLPWMIIFAILDAFFEELLIRGLLLKRYFALLGVRWSLILSALGSGLFFLGVQSVAGPAPYGALILIIPLGLLYAFIMQRSESIWGSLSVHAAVDLIFLIGVFAAV